MAISPLQIRRRINGAGPPPNAGFVAGEMAVAMPGAAGVGTTVEFYLHDGTAWRRVNPATNVATQSITLPAAADIGAAYTAWTATPGNVLTGNIVVASYGTPANVYLLTNSAAPGTAASWFDLASATSPLTFATSAQIITGTDTANPINSAGLRGATVNTSAGAADADKIPRLDASGKLAVTMLPVNALELRGSRNPTAAAPISPVSGDVYFLNANGAFDVTWTGVAGVQAKSGDLVVWDGTTWHHIPNVTDLSAYVPLAGTAAMTGSIGWAASQVGLTVLDGNGGDLTNVFIDTNTLSRVLAMRSSVAAGRPTGMTPADNGSLYVNFPDQQLGVIDTTGAAVDLLEPFGGANDRVFYTNDQTVAHDYSIPAGKNAMSAGPITIATGVTVTVPTGAGWTIA